MKEIVDGNGNKLTIDTIIAHDSLFDFFDDFETTPATSPAGSDAVNSDDNTADNNVDMPTQQIEFKLLTNPIHIDTDDSNDTSYFYDGDDDAHFLAQQPHFGSFDLVAQNLAAEASTSGHTNAVNNNASRSSYLDLRFEEDENFIFIPMQAQPESQHDPLTYAEYIALSEILNPPFHPNVFNIDTYLDDPEPLLDMDNTLPLSFILSAPQFNTPNDSDKKRSFDNMEQKPTQQPLRITTAPQTKENQYLALMAAYRSELARMYDQTVGKDRTLSNQVNNLVDEMDRRDRQQQNSQSAKLLPKTQDHLMKQNKKILSLLVIDETLAPRIAWALAIPSQTLLNCARDAKRALDLDICGLFTSERLKELNDKVQALHLDAHPPQDVCDSFIAQHRLFDDLVERPNTRRRVTLNGNAK